MNRRKISLGLCIMLLLFMFSVPLQPAKAQFVLAYDYDTSKDGNYIAYIFTYLDGVHNGTSYYNPTSYPNDTAVNPVTVDAGTNITLGVFVWLNGTKAGISSLSEGLNFIRHNVTVTANNGTTIFTQLNFTYITGTNGNAPMYFYRYDVILAFSPDYGEIYTVMISYEVFQ